MRTLVFQSCSPTRRPAWMARCLDSVEDWASRQNWDYRRLGDELLDLPPAWVRTKAEGRLQIVADVGRLIAARDFLAAGYDRTVWLDADVLVFAPDLLCLDIETDHAFGREIWVQPGPGGRLRTHRNVHNAVSIFARGNPVLDFLIHTSLAVLDRIEGGVPPQIVGPKLLTALHSIVGFPLTHEVGMLSPPVIRDIAGGGGPALDRMRDALEGPMHAANLCASLAEDLTEDLLDATCSRLLRSASFPPRFADRIG